MTFMGIDPTCWLRQSINVAAKTGVTSSGDPIFSAAAPMLARVKVEQVIAREGAGGSELRNKTTIYTASQIGIQDRVWLPGDDPANADLAKTPMDSSAIPDEQGNTVYWKAVL